MNLLSAFTASLLTVFLLFTGCQRPLITDDEQPSQNNAKWDVLDFKSERLIQSLYATPFDLYAITENEFSRFDANHKLLEKRPLSVEFGVKGIPVMSDNSFVRLTTDQQARQVVEFHLARNANQIVKVLEDSLLSSADTHLEIEFLARKLGAFTDDGTLFLLPAKVFPDRHYALFLFEIQHNSSHNAFISVKMIKRINITDLKADFANLVNMRFLGGNFYITSKEGAWRITPSGSVKKLFSQWMLDFFSWQGQLYATGINTYDLHKSTDNGLNWVRLNQNSAPKLVETPGEMLLTHQVLGHPYQAVTEDFITAKDIVYPSGAPLQNPSVFYSAVFYSNRYYFSIDREIYVTDKIIVK